ncbi:alpha/beta hydrolase [Pseudonocardia sp. C8]|uniref:alpha/beta hydrolase n=1 Tax=Pseudonocardia sp. C8 TaxID=2762759 RepID=UPI001643580E|nr:alpha/beta hydrolase [Pseudonocardia sp. C8]MBC3193745.1 alpha/beta hydrolase [Pseudonocardia sp. C8]
MTDSDGTQTPLAPRFDPEIEDALLALRDATPALSDDNLGALRRIFDDAPPPDLTAGGRIVVDERLVPGPAGAPDVALTVLSPAAATTDLPAIFYVHGGALVLGNRYMYIDELLPYVAESAAVVISVGYRFAPEHPAPGQVEDCYAGLTYTADHAAELGIDPERIIVLGISAGGGLGLGVSLLARDRKGPAPSHQVLVSPMLDDRMETPSSTMLDGYPSDRNDIAFGWRAALGEQQGRAGVSPYVAPARAADLAGLPRTFIDCGGSDGFRDEAIEMAQRLSQAGVLVDLHLWGGGYHGFDFAAPDAAVSRAAKAARDEFVRRALGA